MVSGRQDSDSSIASSVFAFSLRKKKSALERVKMTDPKWSLSGQMSAFGSKIGRALSNDSDSTLDSIGESTLSVETRILNIGLVPRRCVLFPAAHGGG
jgi:hypothetical protein